MAIGEILGGEFIEAHCRDMSEEEATRINFEENFQRLNLTILEEAKAIARFYANKTEREVGQALNKPPKFVAERRLLLTLPEEVQKMFASGRLPPSYIYTISRCPGASKQIALANDIIDARAKADGTLTEKGLARRSTRDRRKIVRTQMSQLMHDGFPVFCAMLLAWAIGDATDEEFRALYETTLKELRDGGSLTSTKIWDEAVG